MKGRQAAISIAFVVVGVLQLYFGLLIRPLSNPEIHVQAVIWTIIVSGFALMTIGATLALRWKES